MVVVIFEVVLVSVGVSSDVGSSVVVCSGSGSGSIGVVLG